MKWVNLIPLLFLCFVPYLIKGQDVVVTLTAMDGKIPVELDSIRVDNLSNGSFMTLDNLPRGVRSMGILIIENSRFKESFKVIGGPVESPLVIGHSPATVKEASLAVQDLVLSDNGFRFISGDSVLFTIFSHNLYGG